MAALIDFNPETGLVEGIDVSNIGAGSQDYGFGYDRLGNLICRNLARTSQSETFGYDSLCRLVGVDGASSFVQYKALGNITKKGSVTDYTYGAYNAGPHAVTTANGISHLYDACGILVNRTEGGSNTTGIVRTSFNKPSRIGMDASDVTSTNYSASSSPAFDHVGVVPTKTSFYRIPLPSCVSGCDLPGTLRKKRESFFSSFPLARESSIHL